jgi:hypothetical protein
VFVVGQRVYYKYEGRRYYGTVEKIQDPKVLGIEDWYSHEPGAEDWLQVYCNWDGEGSGGWMPSHKCIPESIDYRIDQEPLEDEDVL